MECGQVVIERLRRPLGAASYMSALRKSLPSGKSTNTMPQGEEGKDALHDRPFSRRLRLGSHRWHGEVLRDPQERCEEVRTLVLGRHPTICVWTLALAVIETLLVVKRRSIAARPED